VILFHPYFPPFPSSYFPSVFPEGSHKKEWSYPNIVWNPILVPNNTINDYIQTLILMACYAGKGMKRESSKKTKLRGGGKFGTIFSEKLRGEGEKYNGAVSNLSNSKMQFF